MSQGLGVGLPMRHAGAGTGTGVAVETSDYALGPGGLERGTTAPTTTGTGGTIVDANGLLRHAPHNLALQSEQFDNSAWAKNGCSIGVDSVAAPDGTMTADLLRPNAGLATGAGAGVSGYVSQANTGGLIVGRVYTWSCHFKQHADYDRATMLGSDGVNAGAITISLVDGSIVSTEIDYLDSGVEDAGGGWYRAWISRVAAGTGTLSGTRYGVLDSTETTTDGTNGVYVWGAQLEENISPSEYVPTTTAAVWEPRLTHRYTENLLTQTNDLTHADWTALALGVTAGGAGAPSQAPGASVFTLTENTAGTDHTLHNTTITEVTAGETYTVSAFVKPNGRNYAVLEYSDVSSTDGVRMLVNLTDGSVEYAAAYGGGTLVDYRVVQSNRGWWRLVLSASTAADTQMYFALRLSPNETQGTTTIPSYKGDATKGVYVCAPQFQAGAFCDAYVASGATATSDWEPHGWVSESGTTNELTAPRDLDDAAWTDVGTVIKTQDAIGLDGVANAAWTVEDNSGSTFEYTEQDVTISADTATHTISCFFKKTTAASVFPGLVLHLIPATSVASSWTVNTDTGTLTARTDIANDGSAVGYIEDWGGWWRVVSSVDNDGTKTTCRHAIIPATATSDTGTWDDTLTGSCVVDWPQVELNTSRASTPCLGVRTDDEVKISTSSIDGWDATQYTMLVEADDGEMHVAMLGADINDRVRVYKTGVNHTAEAVDTAVSQAAFQTVSTDGVYYRTVMSVKANQFYHATNRGQVGADYAGTMPDATTLYIGSDTNGWWKEGVVRRVQLWTKALEKEQVLHLAREQITTKDLTIAPIWAYKFLDNGGMPDAGTGNLAYYSLGYEGTAFDSNGLLRSGRWRPEQEHIGAFMKRGDPKLTMLPVGTTGPELVTNGTFDADLSGFTGSGATWEAPGYARVTWTSGGWAHVSQNMSTVTTAGELYRIRARVKPLANAGEAFIGIWNGEGSIKGTGAAYADVSDLNWQTLEWDYVAGSTFEVRCAASGSGADVQYDWLTVKKVAHIHAIDCDGVDADDDTDGYIGNTPIDTSTLQSGFTLEGWVRSDNETITRTAFAIENRGAFAGRDRVSFELLGDKIIILHQDAGSSVGRADAPDMEFPWGTTAHVAAVFDAGGLHIYVDGVHQATDADAVLPNFTGYLNVGRTYQWPGSSGSVPQPFNGAVGEVALWQTARYSEDFTPRVTPIDRSHPDLLALFQPRPEYEIKGNPKFIPAPWGRAFGHALDCDGVDADDDSDGAVAEISGVGVTAFTLEAKVRIDTVSGAAEVILGWLTYGAGAGSSDISGVLISASSSGWSFQSYDGTTISNTVTTPAPVSGTVYDVALGYDGAGGLSYFVDGAIVGTASDVPEMSSALKLAVGRLGYDDPTPDAGQPFPLDGAVGEVRLSNIARYTADYTPASEPFVWDENTMALFQPGKGFQPTRRRHTYYENLLPYSEDFENAAWAIPATAEIAGSSASPIGAAYRLEEGTADSAQALFQQHTGAQSTFTISVYLKAAERSWAKMRLTSSAGAAAWFDLENGELGTVNAAIDKATITRVGGGWYRCAATATVTDPYLAVGPSTGDGVDHYTGDGSSGIYVSGAQLVRSPNPGPYTKTTSTAAGSWQSDGALIEESRTNSLIASRDLDDAAWTNHNLAASKVQNAVGVDGVVNSAWTIEDNHASSVEDIKQEVAISTSTNTHTGSVLFKKTTSATTFPGFLIGTGASSASFPNSYYIAFNTNTGTGTENAAAAGTGGFYVEDRGEWWEVVINVVADNSHTLLALVIYPAIVESDTDTWDGTLTGSCVIDYPQVELNTAFASSPIETGAAAVTRSADNVEIDNTTITDFPLGAMTLYAEVVKSLSDQPTSPDDTEALIEAYVDDNNRALLSFGAGGGVPRQGILNPVTAGTSDPDIYPTPTAKGASAKLAGTVGANNVHLTVDGTSTGSPDPSHTLADLSAGDTGIGSRVSAGGFHINSTIAEVRIYPYALSDAEREDETS